jgi:saccharopine dehydrogenase (NADP+, L-glutamate forming)
MCVALKAERDGETVWHKTYTMDAWGDERGSAMARLVSSPVAMAIEAVLDERIAAGVSAAPAQADLVSDWLDTVGELAQHIEVVTH